jgi:hypothetical protein
MKRSTLLILIIFVTTGLNAQSLLPIKYGVKIGVNISSLSISAIEGEKEPINSSQIGIAAGTCIYIPLSDKWYINPELLYSQKGASFDYDFKRQFGNTLVSYETTNQLTLSYLELNPTISFKANDKLALNFGPSISFLIGEKYSQDPSEFIFDTTEALITDELVKASTLDIGLNVGLSYFITENFLVETRVYTGLMTAAEATQPYQEGNAPEDPHYTLKNRAIVFSLAYLF